MLLGLQRYGKVDIRVKVNGGGNVAQVYAVRQAIGKALVAYYQKCTFALLLSFSTSLGSS